MPPVTVTVMFRRKSQEKEKRRKCLRSHFISFCRTWAALTPAKQKEVVDAAVSLSSAAILKPVKSGKRKRIQKTFVRERHTTQNRSFFCSSFSRFSSAATVPHPHPDLCIQCCACLDRCSSRPLGATDRGLFSFLYVPSLALLISLPVLPLPVLPVRTDGRGRRQLANIDTACQRPHKRNCFWRAAAGRQLDTRSG